MANVLDENVVVLRFDNSDFQKNTEDSISSLDKLTNKLKNSDSGEGLKGLGKAAKSFNLDNMSNAVDKVNKRFSLFGIAGMATINRLTNSAITATKNMVTAIPKQIIQGGWQRALNIENAKFMIEGLGHSWEDTWDKAGNKVEGVKQSVLAAVNQTRYGLDEAAGIAGQLLASNVKNGEELTSALQSISGLASVTNSQYSDIGRIYAQVAGQGRLMGDQLLQISSRGINAAAAIQEYLNKNTRIKDEALAAAIATGKQTTKMKELSEQAELSEGDVRDMVSAGAISFDVFSKSMAGFWDQAQRANETYEGSLANVNASLSRMGAKFEGFKLEALKNIFNTLLPILSRIEDLIDPIAEKFGKATVAATDFIREGILNPIGKALGAEKLFHGFGEEAKNAGDKTKKANEQTKKSTESVIKTLKVSKKEWQAALDIWNKGTYGTGKEREAAIRKLGMSYENVQGIINKFYETGFDWKKTKNAFMETKKVKEETEGLGEAAEEAQPKLSTLGSVVTGLMNVAQIVKNVFTAFKNILVVTGKFLVSIFSGPVKTGAEGFLKLSSGIADTTKSFADFTGKLAKSSVDKIVSKWPKSIQVLFNGIKTGLNWVTSHIGPAISTIVKFFKELSVSEGVVKLKDALKGVYDSVSTLAGGALKKVVDYFKEINLIGSSRGVMDAIVNFFSKLAGGLADLINKIRAGQSPFKILGDAISGLRDKLSFKGIKTGGKGGIAAKLSDILSFDSLKQLGDKIKNLDIATKIKELFTNVADFAKDSAPFEKLKNLDFGGFFKTLGEKLGDVDWGRFTELATKIGGLVLAFKAFKDMRSVTDAAVGTMGSVSGFFTSLSGLSDTIKKKIKIDSFKTIAIAIAILVGCVIALALIPTNRLIPALAGVVGMLGVLTGIIALMNSEKFDADKLQSIGIAFAGMGASLMLLALSLAVMAKIKVADIIKGGIAIAAFVGMLVLASKLSGDIKGAGGAFIGLATAVNLLLVAMLAFAALSIGVILKGGLVILGLVTSLALAARIANGSKTGGFVSMANAVNLLIPAITAFAFMPTERIVKGGLAVVGLVTALGLAARIAGEGSLKGMTGVSVAVGVLAAALVVLSMIDTEKLIVSGSVLVGLMTSLSIAAKIAQKSIGGLIVMGLTLGMIATALAILATMDVNASLKTCLALSALAVSLGISMALFSTIGAVGAAYGVAGLAVAIAGVGLILAAVGALDKALEKYNIKGFIDRGIPILVSIASGMGQVIGAFVSGLLAQLATGGLSVVAKNLANFMDELKPFFDSLKEQKNMSAMVGTVKDMASVFTELGKANLFNAGAEFLGGDTMDMEDFGEQLKKFTKGFKKFAKEAGEIDEADLAAALVVAKIAKVFGDIQAGMESTGGLKGFVMGNKEDLGTFGEQLGGIIGAVGSSVEKLRELKITDDDVELIKPVVKIIKTFAGLELPKSGGLLQGLEGNTTLSEFGTFLSDFITSFSEFLPKLRELDFGDDVLGKDGKLAKVVNVVKTMVEAGSGIPPSDGLKQFVEGNTTLPEFAKQLGDFAEKFQDFVTKTADIDTATFEEALPKIGPIAAAVTVMAVAAQSVPEAGGVKQAWTGGKNLGSFGVQLLIFALTLKPFISKVGAMEIPDDFNSKISRLAGIVKSMAKVAQAVPDDESVFTKLKNLVKLKIDEAAIKSVTKSVKLVSQNSEGLKTENVTNLSKAVKALGAISGDMKSLKGIPTGANLPKLADNVKEFTETMGDVSVKGLKGKASAVRSAASSLAKAASSSVKINTSGASKSGSDLGSSMAKGISASKGSVSRAAKALRTAASEGVKGNTTAFYNAGKSCGQGFARGLEAMKSTVGAKGTSLGNYAYQKAKEAIKSKSPSRKFMELGVYAGEGFAIGMDNLKRRVGRSGYDMAMASVEGANSALSYMDDFSSPIITPVLDMSQVRTGAQQIDALLSTNKALDVNSIVAANMSLEYERSQAMDKLVNAIGSSNRLTDPKNVEITNYFNVDGTENPEDFADRLMRRIEMESRSM